MRVSGNLGETCTAYEREDRAENRRKSVFGPTELIDGSGRQSFRGHREVIERPVPAYRQQKRVDTRPVRNALPGSK